MEFTAKSFMFCVGHKEMLRQMCAQCEAQALIGKGNQGIELESWKERVSYRKAKSLQQFPVILYIEWHHQELT